MSGKISVAVVGARGYTGAETVKILINHPKVEKLSLFSTQKEKFRISEFIPSFSKIADLEVDVLDERKLERYDAVFLCLSQRESHKTVARMREVCGKLPFVVDLSADFRFSSPGLYKEVYGEDHLCSDLLGEAVYGLTELTRDKIKSARIVGNPGCYPTAFLLGVAPLLRAELPKVEGFIIDAKSGVTGAGRKALPHLTLAYLSENVKVYAWVEHRHVPEMREKLKELFGFDDPAGERVLFTAQLIPAKRGILETIWVRFSEKPNEGKIYDEYERFARENYFFDFRGEDFPDIYSVAGTNFVRVGLRMKGRSAMVVSVLDNLVKGASGQAVQNLNIKFNFDEKDGLSNLPPCYT